MFLTLAYLSSLALAAPLPQWPGGQPTGGQPTGWTWGPQPSTTVPRVQPQRGNNEGFRACASTLGCITKLPDGTTILEGGPGVFQYGPNGWKATGNQGWSVGNYKGGGYAVPSGWQPTGSPVGPQGGFQPTGYPAGPQGGFQPAGYPAGPQGGFQPSGYPAGPQGGFRPAGYPAGSQVTPSMPQGNP
jgi:hypothetical protein